jgi:hypothetical protein
VCQSLVPGVLCRDVLVSMLPVHELRAGLWHWQAPHPDWTLGAPWPRDVSSCAIDDGERLLLFDPLAVPEALLALAREREPVIVLTAPWHERDAQALVELLDAALFAPSPDTAQGLIDKYGITAEQAGDGSPDLQWLRRGGGTGHWYAAGARLPFGIESFCGREHNDLVLWIESVRAVVAGDSLVDFGTGLALNEWLRGDVTRGQVLERLRPLLGLAVEVVLPAHGAPTDGAALESAKSHSRRLRSPITTVAPKVIPRSAISPIGVREVSRDLGEMAPRDPRPWIQTGCDGA